MLFVPFEVHYIDGSMLHKDLAMEEEIVRTCMVKVDTTVALMVVFRVVSSVANFAVLVRMV